MNIKVSHESPLCMLGDSIKYNDYDYALVHLFEHEDEEVAKQYLKFYKNSVADGRVVYLDNSIFELGESFDPEKYAKWILELQPTVYIVPDVLEHCTATIESYVQWFKNLPEIQANAKEIGHMMCMGVVQGRDWTDLVECYKFMSQNADMVAISFDYSYYLNTGMSINKFYDGRWNSDMYETLRKDGDPYLNDVQDPMNCSFCKDKMHRYMTGRQRFIKHLIDEGIWNWNKPHHLLGCSLPQEFKYYVDKNIYNIQSIDTSNPVMAGLNWYRYHDTFGLEGKPRGLLADNINIDSNDPEYNGKRDAALYNTDCFKKIIGREPIYEQPEMRGFHASHMYDYTATATSKTCDPVEEAEPAV